MSNRINFGWVCQDHWNWLVKEEARPILNDPFKRYIPTREELERLPEKKLLNGMTPKVHDKFCLICEDKENGYV